MCVTLHVRAVRQKGSALGGVKVSQAENKREVVVELKERAVEIVSRLRSAATDLDLNGVVPAESLVQELFGFRADVGSVIKGLRDSPGYRESGIVISTNSSLSELVACEIAVNEHQHTLALSPERLRAELPS